MKRIKDTIAKKIMTAGNNIIKKLNKLSPITAIIAEKILLIELLLFALSTAAVALNSFAIDFGLPSS